MDKAEAVSKEQCSRNKSVEITLGGRTRTEDLVVKVTLERCHFGQGSTRLVCTTLMPLGLLVIRLTSMVGEWRLRSALGINRQQDGRRLF